MSVTVVNSTTITAIAPAHAAGPADVVVTNPGGSGGTLTAAFTYSFEEPFTVTPSTSSLCARCSAILQSKAASSASKLPNNVTVSCSAQARVLAVQFDL